MLSEPNSKLVELAKDGITSVRAIATGLATQPISPNPESNLMIRITNSGDDMMELGEYEKKLFKNTHESDFPNDDETIRVPRTRINEITGSQHVIPNWRDINKPLDDYFKYTKNRPSIHMEIDLNPPVKDNLKNARSRSNSRDSYLNPASVKSSDHDIPIADSPLVVKKSNFFGGTKDANHPEPEKYCH